MDSAARLFFRDELRRARAIALKDAEGFQEILFVIERLGALCTGKLTHLGDYGPKIKETAKDSPLAEQIPMIWPAFHRTVGVLFELVRTSRNDALHQGAVARHLADNAIQLAVILEDALMSEPKYVGDLMVRQPVCAELWHPVSFVRQRMLTNSFTYLPFLDKRQDSSVWRILSDLAVAKYIRGSTKDRKSRLVKTVKEATSGNSSPRLKAEEVNILYCDDPIDEAISMLNGPPILVGDKNDKARLVGILTAYDLL